jgi:hypothetical protein
MEILGLKLKKKKKIAFPVIPDECHGCGLLVYEPAENVQHGHLVAPVTSIVLKHLLQERQDHLRKNKNFYIITWFILFPFFV